MGNGIPFPHSGSLSSRLFLFTILARTCLSTSPGRVVEAAAAAAGGGGSSAQVTGELRSRHD